MVADAPPVATVALGSPGAHELIKLGIDVHLDRDVVVRQLDGARLKPPQCFSPAQFVEWAKKQTESAKRMYSCYEAGPFSCSLHRKPAGSRVTHYVVRQQDWDA